MPQTEGSQQKEQTVPTSKRRLWSLQSNELIAAARRRTGLEDFVDPEIEPRLSVLVKSIEAEANLHPLGRFLARMHLRDLLQTRLVLANLWSGLEALEPERIARPIFITGMPRSGSTFLHELLARDRNNRAPLFWEVMFPLPTHARIAIDVDRRIKKAAARLWWFRRLAPRADSVHPIRATTPHECVAIHSYTLLSQQFATMFHAPSYEVFLSQADLRPAYDWQKRFLQHLQIGLPQRRWILKAPDHIFSLDALFGVFPDAAIIQMHRDPLEVLESSIRLTRVLRKMFARRQDPGQVGAREARVLWEGIDRITRFRDSHPDLSSRFVDVNYQELVSNPFRTVQRLYSQLNLPLARGLDERIRSLAFERGRYSHRRDVPALAELGLDAQVEARRFESYCVRFGISQV